MQENSPINIIETIWTYLSPFSAHQISIWGENFATVEHAYQASKFKPGLVRDEVKNATSAYASWKVAQKYKKDKELLDQGFDKDKVMEELFKIKIAQHTDVLEVLKMTGDKCLLKNVESDEYWGVGHDGGGQNKMGKLWMKIRKEKFGV